MQAVALPVGGTGGGAFAFLFFETRGRFRISTIRFMTKRQHKYNNSNINNIGNYNNSKTTTTTIAAAAARATATTKIIKIIIVSTTIPMVIK